MNHRTPPLAALLLLVTAAAAAAQDAPLPHSAPPAATAAPAPPAAPTVSRWVYRGESGHLLYRCDDRGNRVLDFSRVGYRYGAPLPDVLAEVGPERVVTVPVAAGDVTAAIQGAIDRVSAMERDSRGWRGVVQLEAGVYEVTDALRITASGVVLRGRGDGRFPEDGGTVLLGTARSRHHFVEVDGGRGEVERLGEPVDVLDSYVPVGATSFRVADPAALRPGDAVMVQRPGTAAWVAALRMDELHQRFGDADWQPHWASVDLHLERTVLAVEGDRVFLDQPLPTALQRGAGAEDFGGGRVWTYRCPRVEQVGVEHLRAEAAWHGPTDEAHPGSFVVFHAAEHGWARRVTGRHLRYAAVWVHRNSRCITVDGAANRAPQSKIAGGRRYAFCNDGQSTLMTNLWAEQGRHDFVNNAPARGPNVFALGVAHRTISESGPHQRWSVGTLYDNLTIHGATLAAYNRGHYGSGHGHAGANMVFWNCTPTRGHVVENPPTAQNWVIGAAGGPVTDLQGHTDFADTPIAYVDATPGPATLGDPQANPMHSLYLAQAADHRALGPPRVYVLGDFDDFGGVADAAVDAPAPRPAWRDAVLGLVQGDAAALLATDAPLPPGDAVVPLGLRFHADPRRPPVFAQLTVALAQVRDGAALLVGDAGRVLPVAELDLISPAAGYPRGRRRMVVIEFHPSSPVTPVSLLAGGTLDLAVRRAAVDWAELRLHHGP